MKILMLTPALPWPTHQGGAMRSFGLLHGLYQVGHDVTVLSFGEWPESESPLFRLCSQVITVPLPQRSTFARLRDVTGTGTPDLARRLDSARMRSRLDELLQQQRFDLVQFEGLEMCGLLSLVRSQQPGGPCCYDATNAEYKLQQNIFAVDRQQPARWPAAAWSWLQARRIARFERSVCEQVSGTLAVSAEDATALRALAPQRQVRVVPNGIFISDYDAVPKQPVNAVPTLAFTGKMDYRPNVDAMLWFCAKVLPLVQQHSPDCRLNIVGQSPHSSLQQLDASRHITVTGRVERIQPWLHGCDVYVAPLRMGSGTRLKILEAMASGCAIVASSLAAAGLPAALKETLLVANSEADMATGIISLLEDPPRRKDMGSAARAAVCETSDWSAILPQMLSAWQSFGI